jgi:hypothetical protein
MIFNLIVSNVKTGIQKILNYPRQNFQLKSPKSIAQAIINPEK